MSNEFQKLTIKDSFMFATVMSDEEQCRQLLEIALDMKILSVRVITEKTFSYHSDYHGVRLHVFAWENGTQIHFNVEMQVERPKSLPRRTRYYHSQMDDEDERVLDDGHITVLLNTKGENDPEISSALRHFLKYVENPNHPKIPPMTVMSVLFRRRSQTSKEAAAMELIH